MSQHVFLVMYTNPRIFSNADVWLPANLAKQQPQLAAFLLSPVSLNPQMHQAGDATCEEKMWMSSTDMGTHGSVQQDTSQDTVECFSRYFGMRVEIDVTMLMLKVAIRRSGKLGLDSVHQSAKECA